VQENAVNLNNIRDLDVKVDRLEVAAEGQKEDLKSMIDAGCAALRICKDAFKSARKLRKLKPGDMKAWLDSFDACRDALGYDAQIDLLDQIAEQAANEKAQADAEKPARKRFRKGAELASIN
jgi:hypothetical protein